MIRVAIIALLILCLPMLSEAQYYNQTNAFLKANSRWIFGDNVGYSKQNNASFPVSGFSSFGATATVCDPNTGALLFYMDEGRNCWDRNGVIMPNGTNLGGGGRTQSVVVIPFIQDPNKFYIFTQQDPFSSQGSLLSPNAKLYYSIVDMSLNNGLGDIVVANKRTLLDSAMSSSIIAVPGNNCDIWLIGHEQYQPIFKAWRISNAGLNITPVVSTAGPAPYTNAITATYTWYQGFVQGEMAISPDRSMVVLGTTSLNGIMVPGKTLGTVLCKFNADNGVINDPIQINSDGAQHSYGVCFSPDNTKLYINLTSSSNAPTGIHQYDISTYDSTSISQSDVFVTPATSMIKWNYMKLYRDTIYISQQGIPSPTGISTICNPNGSGTSCNYQYMSIPGIGNVYQGLPNDVVLPPTPDTAYRLSLDTTLCKALTPMVLHAPQGSSHQIWDDGSTGDARIITTWGTYWVASRQSECGYAIDTFIIRGSNFKIDLGEDQIICNQPSFILNPHASVTGGTTYLWDNGSVDSSLLITATGNYWVKVSNNGCSLYDSIHIDLIDVLQDLGPDNIACRGTPLDLMLIANASDDAVIRWSDGSSGKELHVTNPGLYSLRVEEEGCMGYDEIQVVRNLCDCIVMAPNAFSPNGDGLNDIYNVSIEPGCLISAYALQIYNRWGQRIFTSLNSQTGWDGNFKGKPCDAGVYYYTIRLEKGTDSNDWEQKGEITLIR